MKISNELDWDVGSRKGALKLAAEFQDLAI